MVLLEEGEGVFELDGRDQVGSVGVGDLNYNLSSYLKFIGEGEKSTNALISEIFLNEIHDLIGSLQVVVYLLDS